MKWDLEVWLQRGPVSPRECWAWAMTGLSFSMTDELGNPSQVSRGPTASREHHGTDLLKDFRLQEVSRTWEQLKQHTQDSRIARLRKSTCLAFLHRSNTEKPAGRRGNPCKFLPDVNVRKVKKITNGLEFVLATSLQRETEIDGQIKITFLAWHLYVWAQMAPVLEDWFRACISVWSGGVTGWNCPLNILKGENSAKV